METYDPKNDDGNLPPIPKPYSVPRRFGIGTILAVATAFAVLIWMLQFLNAPPPLIVTIAIFLTIVGGMQVLFENAPRVASMWAGLICTIGMLVYFLWEDFQQGARINAVLCLSYCLCIVGAFIGYCGGIVVAGVFLVMDRLTGILSRKTDGKEKSPFD